MDRLSAPGLIVTAHPDAAELLARGVRGVFGPGTNTDDVAAFVRAQVEAVAYFFYGYWFSQRRA